MIDMLVADLEKEIQTMEVDEKNSQQEYEELMKVSAEKRASDAKSVMDKEAAKADMEANLQKLGDESKATQAEAMAKGKTLMDLHGECDWLIQNFETRKEARAGEVVSLTNAKAVLSGADYSLVQIASTSQTCPSTSFECGMQKDAAGDTVFVKTELPSPDTCVNIGSKVPDDGEFKICGPGSFSLSRMSCDKHDYKAVTINHPTDAFTASDCKTYKLADYYQIHGYIGSAQYSCGETAR